MGIEEREALKTYLLNLRYKIGQIVVASYPKNLNLAQQLVVDREQWLQEANRVANRLNNQSDNTTPVCKRNATDPQPRAFNQPSGDRMKIKCSKCLRIGHTAEICYCRNFPFASRGKMPPRVKQTTENPEETYQVNCTTTGRLLPIVLQPRNGGRARFLIDTGAGMGVRLFHLRLGESCQGLRRIDDSS
ncbi:uncharacterized protein LOC122569955 [Bombus pyrosoma]|uniref:uncharacterized protein LOC122569955 n=1 Tax=Bombus pyrosoma TaxID=396416 RepID=UPI001CB930C5|nr:uncharacterized protein LOC122569955 [Bombus pyrosoma]